MWDEDDDYSDEVEYDSGECFERPWFNTSQGESPSFDSRISTIPSANTKSPTIRLANLTA